MVETPTPYQRDYMKHICGVILATAGGCYKLLQTKEVPIGASFVC